MARLEVVINNKIGDEQGKPEETPLIPLSNLTVSLVSGNSLHCGISNCVPFITRHQILLCYLNPEENNFENPAPALESHFAKTSVRCFLIRPDLNPIPFVFSNISKFLYPTLNEIYKMSYHAL